MRTKFLSHKIVPVTAVEQPSGTVTLVFTDIEGSTRLLEELGVDGYRDALAEHRRVVREACARHEGYEVDYEGDAFFYAFGSAQAAVWAVREAMSGLDGGPIRIRVGIHTGEPALDPPKYVGLDVHRAARIMSSAHGGQVVLSPSTVALLDSSSVEPKDLGRHRLKDLSAPIPLYQLPLDGKAQDFPPLKTLYRSNLPVPATPFLGRKAELSTLGALLAAPDMRLITLTGPGGSGKTRLALQAAADASDRYPDGVFWVPLAPLRDPTLVLPAIARALDVSEQPGETPTATLVNALADRKRLLLLDNLEHLLPEGADDVSDLVAGCPSLQLLVTSRERLQLQAETVWPVPPLAESDGEALFVERALAAGVELEVDPTIAELCRRLDQLPLAIQLAAARTRSLSPTRILEILGTRAGILSSRSRDVEARQRTLEATIAWSYELLDPEEQRVFRGLSVFAGGCTFEAASWVVGADLDVLEGLLDKSLVRHTTDGLGADRYWMLETVRDFAGRRLEDAGESAVVFEAFLDWLDTVVGEVDEWWLDRDQLEWFERLEVERPNLMHAVAECHRRGRFDDATRLIVAASEFFDTRGPWEVIADLLDPELVDHPRLAGRCGCARAMLLIRRERFREAMAVIEAAYERALELGDDAVASRALALEAPFGVILGAHTAETSMPRAEQAVRLAERSGDRYALAHALNGLGIVTSTIDSATARSLFSEALDVAASIGDQRNAALIAGNLVCTSLASRRPAEAITAATEALSVARRLGDVLVQATLLGLLAFAHVASGDAARCRERASESLNLVRDSPDESLVIEELAVLAMAAATSDPGRAIRLWSASERFRQEAGYTLPLEMAVYTDELLAPLRQRPDFDDDWRGGQRLSLDEAIALGLEEAERDYTVAATS